MVVTSNIRGPPPPRHNTQHACNIETQHPQNLKINVCNIKNMLKNSCNICNIRKQIIATSGIKMLCWGINIRYITTYGSTFVTSTQNTCNILVRHLNTCNTQLQHCLLLVMDAARSSSSGRRRERQSAAGHPLTSSHPGGVESGGPPSGRRGVYPRPRRSSTHSPRGSPSTSRGVPPPRVDQHHLLHCYLWRWLAPLAARPRPTYAGLRRKCCQRAATPIRQERQPIPPTRSCIHGRSMASSGTHARTQSNSCPWLPALSNTRTTSIGAGAAPWAWLPGGEQRRMLSYPIHVQQQREDRTREVAWEMSFLRREWRKRQWWVFLVDEAQPRDVR
jgi:hypothetical protein